MLEFLEKFWLLGLIVGLFIMLLAAFNFAEIAKTKGHSYGKYFAWCFFTGIIGWIMVIALPNQADEMQTDLAEAEKAKTVKVVRILTITILVIALMMWIGVSVHDTKVKEEQSQIEYIQDLENWRNDTLKELNEMEKIPGYLRNEQQKKDIQALWKRYKTLGETIAEEKEKMRP